MDMRTDFSKLLQQSESIPFPLLQELLPHVDFRSVIFPLWVDLKERGYIKCNSYRLDHAIHDDQLETVLRCHLPHHKESYIKAVANSLQKAGVMLGSFCNFIQNNGPKNLAHPALDPCR